MNLRFSRDSWHYKLASAGGYHYRNDENDICTYTRACMKACISGLIVALIFTAIAYLLVHMILGLGFSLWFGTWLMTELGMIALIVTLAGLFAGTITYSIERYKNWRRARRNYLYENPQPDSFLKHAYKSVKGKYCARIIFDE